MKTDLQLRHDVEAELDWDPRFDSREIAVAVKHGVVTLTGHVSSFVDRWAAQGAAQSVAGVQAMANDIVVKLATDLQRTDTDIAEAAVNTLAANVSVPAGAVKIVVNDGWVSLNGELGLAYQKDAAERALRPLRGVRGLSNNITIKPRPISAADVKRKIEEAFRRHAQADAQTVRVQAFDGTVTLDGEVRTWRERQDAEDAAWFAPGVSKVVDNLQIRP